MDKLSNEVYTALNELFGVASCELNFKNNYELLVSVILSARCTDKRVNEITPNLFKSYPNAKFLAKAKQEDVEKIIYSCGFYKNKAKNIIAMAKDLVDKYDGVVPDEFDKLVALSGVGRKTANVVLSVGFKKQTIAVDTHVFRVSNRLGLAEAKTPIECEMALQKRIDKDKWAQIHHYLVLYGRYYCKAQNPSCENCKFSSFCLYKNGKVKDYKY